MHKFSTIFFLMSALGMVPVTAFEKGRVKMQFMSSQPVLKITS